MSAALDRVSPTTSSDPSTSWLSPHMGAGQWRDSIAGIAASRSAGRSRRTSVDAQELSSPESRVHSWSDFGNLASSSSVSRGSLGGSSRDPWESAQSRTSHTSSSKSNSRAASDLYGYGPGSEQWWEHVLPPGQLAERLRRAQRSSDRGEAIDTVDSKPRRSGSSSLSGATRTERGVWTKLADLSKSDEVGAFSHRRRDGHGSQGRTQSLKGDGKKTPNGGNASGGVSADVSSDEYISSPGQRSPQALGGGHFGDYSDHELSSGHHSPFASFRPEHGLSWLGVERNSSIRSFSRSTTSRRSRVISEEGVGLGIGSIKAQEQPVQESKANSHGQTGQHLRRFPTSGYLSSSLSETPEGSSDDNSESRRSDTVSGARASDTATIRPKRTSAPASPRLRGVNEIPRPDFSRSPNLESNTLPRASRSRHVSFDGSADISTRLHRAEALPSSQSQFAVGGAGSSNPFKQASWNPERSFDSLPPRSSTFRRSRTGVRAQGDKRHPSFSAPTSRRGSIHLEDRPPLFGNATRKTGHRRTEVRGPTSHLPARATTSVEERLRRASRVSLEALRHPQPRGLSTSSGRPARASHAVFCRGPWLA
ncbi:hypothetical protein IE53DRAFT_202321 [Violaceomyces palustris]|uniref:Uncharacterized protein n=1 Tax=Violaceomyces palustris TaxID=1673888 RepID=A0ACD0NRB6_9BASI|nr:hypothetical protein IE53DRAFT_202321 [Violaceomyces palustris]